MKFLHSMLRIKNVDESLHFYCDILGLRLDRKKDSEQGRFSLYFLRVPNQDDVEIELTHNWDNDQDYSVGRNFGHLAFHVDDIYEFCQMLLDKNIIINRPPRDGRMAFIKSPDNISIELLQKGEALEIKDPWKNMENIGSW